MEEKTNDLGKVKIGSTCFLIEELEKECPGFSDWYSKNKEAIDKNDSEILSSEVLKWWEANLAKLRRKRYGDMSSNFVRDLSCMAYKYVAVSNLEILQTVAMVRRFCPVCHCSHKDADTLCWIFLSDIPICHNCAERYAPDLLEIVSAANAHYWLEDPDERVPDDMRMEILAPVLSDEEKVKLWGENWGELLEQSRIFPASNPETELQTDYKNTGNYPF